MKFNYNIARGIFFIALGFMPLLNRFLNIELWDDLIIITYWILVVYGAVVTSRAYQKTK